MRSLSGRDDLAARRVVLGVGGEDQGHVQLQPDRVAFDLDVPFLHDVEEAHLDLSRQVGQLVHRKDPAVRPRQQAVVNGELIGQVQAAPRRPDGIHVADDVRDGHVRRRQLLDVAQIPGQPRDRRLVSLFRDALATGSAERCVRVVVDLAPGDHRDLVVQQAPPELRRSRLFA